MARLIPFPDIPLVSQQPLAGPETIGSGQNTTIGKVTQSIAAPFGAWAWKFAFRPMRGQEYVGFRGWLFALQKGANATRWRMAERDMMTNAAAGVRPDADGMAWSNGRSWSSGLPWGFTLPNVRVAASTARDGSIIRLADHYWGARLGWGRRIGFFPGHFGMYQVTEVIAPGQYRIWPPLRKAIKPGDYATLYPVLAMRLMVQDYEYPSEEQSHTTGASVSLMEVFDYDVRDYFAE
jgi:hypothetical protein